MRRLRGIRVKETSRGKRRRCLRQAGNIEIERGIKQKNQKSRSALIERPKTAGTAATRAIPTAPAITARQRRLKATKRRLPRRRSHLRQFRKLRNRHFLGAP